MPLKGRRIVVQGAEARAQLDRLAYKKGWELSEMAQASDERPFQVIWTDDSGSRIRYIQDHIVGLRYVEVSGPRQSEIADEILSVVDNVDLKQAKQIAEAATTRDAKIEAVYVAGASAPRDADDGLLEIFDRAFSDPDPDVRRAAIVAAGYAEWPEFRSRLTQLGNADPDSEVREDVRVMLEGLELVWREQAG